MTSVFDSTFVGRLRAKLAVEIKDVEPSLLDGAVSNFEGYKRLVGLRAGLVRALEAIDEVERELSAPPADTQKRSPAA